MRPPFARTAAIVAGLLGTSPAVCGYLPLDDRLAQVQQPPTAATENILELRRDQLQGPLKEHESRGATAPRGPTSAESDCRDKERPGEERMPGSVPCGPAGERRD